MCFHLLRPRDFPLLMLVVASWTFAAMASADPVAAATSNVPAKSVTTFHCLSLYWSPEGGEAARHVLVKYREAGQNAWCDGLPMRYNPVKTPECKADYRGSVVRVADARDYRWRLPSTTPRCVTNSAT